MKKQNNKRKQRQENKDRLCDFDLEKIWIEFKYFSKVSALNLLMD